MVDIRIAKVNEIIFKTEETRERSMAAVRYLIILIEIICL